MVILKGFYENKIDEDIYLNVENFYVNNIEANSNTYCYMPKRSKGFDYYMVINNSNDEAKTITFDVELANKEYYYDDKELYMPIFSADIDVHDYRIVVK